LVATPASVLNFHPRHIPLLTSRHEPLLRRGARVFGRCTLAVRKSIFVIEFGVKATLLNESAPLLSSRILLLLQQSAFSIRIIGAQVLVEDGVVDPVAEQEKYASASVSRRSLALYPPLRLTCYRLPVSE
jgi:hypothetical protein